MVAGKNNFLSAWGFSLLSHFLAAVILLSFRLPTQSPSYTMVDLVGPGEKKLASSANPAQPKSAKKSAGDLPMSNTSAPSPSAGDSASSSSGEGAARLLSLEETYISGVRSDLEKKKFYPPLARRLGQKGKLVLRITVAQDGSIASSELIEKSSFPLLNSAAQSLLYAVNRFQPFPGELKKTSITFNMPIVYSVE